MAKFIKIKCLGCLNSFRQPDFHTYHKTLPLPPKPTIAGMLGSAAGLSPEEVNQMLLLDTGSFLVGICGKDNGRANDLWQIRKYETKTIAAYKKGKTDTPYKTAVIIRELLYHSYFNIYLSFSSESHFRFFFEKIRDPEWALSLGREDELIKIELLQIVDYPEISDCFFSHTLAISGEYKIKSEYLSQCSGVNLLARAPTTVNLPKTFSYKEGVREAISFENYLFVDDLPIKLTNGLKTYHDTDEDLYFQLI
jgi:CRISPR-associated Cas5-like protein